MLRTVAKVKNRKVDDIMVNRDAGKQHTLQVSNVRFSLIDKSKPPPATELSAPLTDDELQITRERVYDILQKVCPSATRINKRRGMAFKISSRNT